MLVFKILISDFLHICSENLYWPSFRSISHTLTEIEILEPGFYAKIENNLYLDGKCVAKLLPLST
jgi:hypothetical protein